MNKDGSTYQLIKLILDMPLPHFWEDCSVNYVATSMFVYYLPELVYIEGTDLRY